MNFRTGSGSIKQKFTFIFATLILIVSYLFLTSFTHHELHLSVCTFDIENKQINVTIKTFPDDLKLAAGSNRPEQYIRNHIKIYSNNKTIDYNISLKSKSENESFYTSAIIVNDAISSLTVENYLFSHVFADQTNLVIFNSSKNSKGYTLNSKETSCTFEP